MDDVSAAKILIGCLDLTSLNDKDTENDIHNLCKKAITPYGNVAAICVHTKFIPQVLHEISNSNIKIATVVNFPDGGTDFTKLTREISRATSLGADEIDAVFPYKNLINNDIATCEEFLRFAREATQNSTLKIINESGELKKTDLIIQASNLCIKHGVDFIKTSTGKTPTSATPEAANAILEVILEKGKNKVGIKASGGIKTIEDAKKYLTLSQSILGNEWASPKNFRIGASSLLDDLINVIKRGY